MRGRDVLQPKLKYPTLNADQSTYAAPSSMKRCYGVGGAAPRGAWHCATEVGTATEQCIIARMVPTPTTVGLEFPRRRSMCRKVTRWWDLNAYRRIPRQGSGLLPGCQTFQVS